MITNYPRNRYLNNIYLYCKNKSSYLSEFVIKLLKNIKEVKKINITNLSYKPSSKLWIKIIIVLLILTVLILAGKYYLPHKNIKNVTIEEFVYHLDERIPTLMNHYDIPGLIIALVQEGETVWTKGYGYANLKEKIKMTTDTYCRVESISKSVTAWGVMKLVEKGKISLDTPVKTYIKNWKFPESEFSWDTVTVRQLLTHSAGMPLGTIGVIYSPNEDKPSLEDSLSNDAFLVQEPGKSFLYSNTGFNLLELLIEEVTGRDFAEYMEEEILIPLGMTHSSFNWSKNWEPGVPIGYDEQGKEIPVYVYPDKASGGLFATIEDIATFISAGMTDFSKGTSKVLNPESIKKIYTPMVELTGYYNFVFDAYGFGHYIETLSNGKKAVSHGGQGSGWMTHFHSVPETGDGIVILTNSQRSWPFFAYLLTDWAQWRGFGSVGMGIIILVTKILWVMISIIIIISLFQIWRLTNGIISGRRTFRVLSKEKLVLRFTQSGLFIILLSCFLWAVNQEYLFISSVFPIATRWLGLSILLSAVVSLLSALFPCILKRKVND